MPLIKRRMCVLALMYDEISCELKLGVKSVPKVIDSRVVQEPPPSPETCASSESNPTPSSLRSQLKVSVAVEAFSRLTARSMPTPSWAKSLSECVPSPPRSYAATCTDPLSAPSNSPISDQSPDHSCVPSLPE